MAGKAEKQGVQEQEQEETEINEGAVTIFEAIPDKQRIEAIKALLTGKTPEKYILERPARGGGIAKYVNTYYMTRQASLVTGFRWSSECLKEQFRPNEQDPVEIGALMKVTLLDSSGNEVSHISWGGKEVAKYSSTIVQMDKKGSQVKDAQGKLVIIHNKGDIISLFDDLKAAYSDGIKKCLSYFGIANDIYGSKDYEAYEEELNDPKAKLTKYIKDNDLSYSEQVFPTLEVKSFSEITDFEDALKKLKEKFG